MNNEPKTIRLPIGLKPSLAASSDSTRYVLNGANIEGNKITATDGRLAVEMEIDGSLDEPLTIPSHMLKKIESSKIISGEMEIEGEEITVPNLIEGTKTVGRAIEGRFPDAKKIIDEAFNRPSERHVAVNVSNLVKIARALGCKPSEMNVELSIGEDGTPIRVRVPSCETPHRAIVMPNRIIS